MEKISMRQSHALKGDNVIDFQTIAEMPGQCIEGYPASWQKRRMSRI
jgi:hypothetical protein